MNKIVNTKNLMSNTKRDEIARVIDRIAEIADVKDLISQIEDLTENLRLLVYRESKNVIDMSGTRYIDAQDLIYDALIHRCAFVQAFDESLANTDLVYESIAIAEMRYAFAQANFCEVCNVCDHREISAEIADKFNSRTITRDEVKNIYRESMHNFADQIVDSFIERL